MVARRTLLATGLAAAGPLAALPARAQEASLRLAQCQAGDQLLLRLAGLAAAPYRAERAEFGSGKPDAGSGGGRVARPRLRQRGAARLCRLVGRPGPHRGRGPRRRERAGGAGAPWLLRAVGRRPAGKARRLRARHHDALLPVPYAGRGRAVLVRHPVGQPDARGAFRAGSLDAWAICGYSVPLAEQAGARVLRTAAGILSGNYPCFASPDALADPARRAAVAGHLRRLAQAFRWLDAHHAEYAAAQAPLIGRPAAAVQDLLDGASQPRRLVPPDDAAVASRQAVADAFHRAGLLPRPVDVSPLWDRSLDLGEV